MIDKVTFNVRVGHKSEIVTEKTLRDYAELIGLAKYAPNRFSWVFVMDVFANEKFQGIDSSSIMNEIRDLELGENTTGTKPAEEFKREPLKGLWHKHYFTAHFIGQNIQNHLARGKLEEIVKKTFGSGPKVTAEMIENLAAEISYRSYEKRSDQQKITGEWIIFGKHKAKNYYLRLTTHRIGDQNIYDQIKHTCLLEFPFLKI